jgi:hypothetical protein
MLRSPVTIATVALSALLLPAFPAQGQENEEAEERGLTSPEVKESLTINPTEQGTLPPKQLNEDDEPLLYDLLTEIRRAPPTLDAINFVPRPNEFAREPAKEMVTEGAQKIILFPEGYVE